MAKNTKIESNTASGNRSPALLNSASGFPCLTKYVPTDMDWSGNYAGCYVCVGLVQNGPAEGGHHMVHVYGSGNTSLVRFFRDLDAAVALYDSLRYLQGYADLVTFAEGPDANNNGWPCSRDDLVEAFRESHRAAIRIGAVQPHEPFDFDVDEYVVSRSTLETL